MYVKGKKSGQSWDSSFQFSVLSFSVLRKATADRLRLPIPHNDRHKKIPYPQGKEFQSGAACRLALREVRIGFHFQDLFGVALAVGGDEENPFVAVELLSHGAVSCVLAQVGSLLE